MIIKKIALDSDEQKSHALMDEKGPSPRIVIKLKKNLKIGQKVHSNQENHTEKESIPFNDSSYFAGQYCFIKSSIANNDTDKTKPSFQEPRPRKLSSNYETKNGHDFAKAAENGFSQREFIDAMRKQTFQNTIRATLFYPDIASEGNSRREFSTGRKKISMPATQQVRQHPKQNGGLTVGDLEALKQYARLNIKLVNDHKSCLEVNPYTNKEYFHKRVTQSSNERRTKKFNSVDYNIIKPNEIKAAPLSQRDEKATIFKRKKDRKNFPELMAALQRKEQLKRERQRARRESTRQQPRSSLHTSLINRAYKHEIEDKNELLPWDMQGSTYNLDFI